MRTEIHLYRNPAITEPPQTAKEVEWHHVRTRLEWRITDQQKAMRVLFFIICAEAAALIFCVCLLMGGNR
jgi:hypothetical protein